MVMYEPSVETMDPAQRAEQQLRDLRGLVDRLAGGPADFWRRRLDGVSSGDLRSLDDLADLPLMVKADFRDHYPFGLLAVPLDETVRVHASSGTSGRPTVVAYTRDDLAVFAATVARAIGCAGGQPSDVLHVAYGYGLFTGGLGLHQGGEALGATVVPASGGNTPLQLQLLADLGATGLAATPSFAMLLAERAAAQGVTGLRVRYGVLGAEPWSLAFRDKLEQAWSALTGGPFDACDIYGLSEVMGPGIAMECREGKSGLHVFDDHYLPEVIDPETGRPLGVGERGELVLTTLTKQALPVLRYRTGDITSLLPGDCPCGRTHPRIGRIEGRVDDMLIIRGVNVFPREIEAVVLEHADLAGAYAIVVDRRQALVRLEVRVETTELLRAEVRQALARELQRELSSRLRIRVDVAVHDPGDLPRTEVGKVKRVFELTGAPDDPRLPDPPV